MEVTQRNFFSKNIMTNFKSRYYLGDYLELVGRLQHRQHPNVHFLTIPTIKNEFVHFWGSKSWCRSKISMFNDQSR